MTTSKSWLGVSLNFDGVDDSTSKSSGNKLLQCGFYKAEIKNIEVKSTNENSYIEVVCELEEEKKEVKATLWLPKKTDKAESIDIKKRNIKNFLTRAFYNEITEADYRAMSRETIDATTNELQAGSPKALIGKKVQVKIEQNPFVVTNKETKAIEFLNVSKANLLAKMPNNILKAIQYLEKKANVSYEKMPKIAFTNNIAMNGFDFYLDYKDDANKYDSSAYLWYQGINNKKEEEPIELGTDTEEEIPF